MIKTLHPNRHLSHNYASVRLSQTNNAFTPRSFISLCFIAFMVFTSTQAASNPQPANAKQADYQQKMKDAQQNIQKLQAELKQVMASKTALESKLAQNEKKLGDLNKKIRKVEGELASEKKQLALLNEQRTALMASLSKQESYLKQQLLALYQQHRQGAKLSLSLSPVERAKLPRLLRYQQRLTEQQYQQLSGLQVKEQTLKKLALQLEQRQTTLNIKNSQLTSQKHALEQSRHERKELLSALSRKASSSSQQLRKAKQEREALASVLAAIQKEITRAQLTTKSRPFRQERGKLGWPTVGKIKFSYGSPRQPFGKWDGVWISARKGTAVKSVHEGRVVFANWLRGFGLLVIVDHGNGYMSLYGHNESLDVALGDKVNKHQTIAHVGSSGGKEDVGLYFSIRHKGKPQNPSRWCS